VKANKLLWIIVVLLLEVTLHANGIKEEALKHQIPVEYAQKFSALIVQSKDGRMKPLDSLNLDILNKIASVHSVYSLSYNQVVLSMAYAPWLWKNVPLIQIQHPLLKKRLNTEAKRIGFNDLFYANSTEYKLSQETKSAHLKEEKKRNSYEKALIKLYEKVQILQFIYDKGFLKIFPLPQSQNNRWYSPLTLKQNFSNEAKYEAQLLYVQNKKQVLKALQTQQWQEALAQIDDISRFQHKYGEDIMPSETKIAWELFYNKVLIFEKLYALYLFLGMLLFVLCFKGMFGATMLNTALSKGVKYVIVVLFALHGMGLLLRWYISSHAPWSNAYESMVFISLTIVFAGIFFSKKSDYALSATTFLAGVLLFGAHLSFLDPQITNLTPNLQSFWLTSHVAIISASYGFLALSALLGLLMVALFIIHTKKTQEVILQHLNRVCKINELSMFIGFFLLILGTVLGSVWANESWGRVWGWDPKESWSLICILVYMIIIHLRMRLKLNSLFMFAALSFVAYGTVLMTYFGVNYFFDAIHVYASNSNIELSWWFYCGIIFVVLFLCYGHIKAKQMKKCL
jgi:cytochrome c-type biogenesis protein CcsB